MKFGDLERSPRLFRPFAFSVLGSHHLRSMMHRSRRRDVVQRLLQRRVGPEGQGSCRHPLDHVDRKQRLLDRHDEVAGLFGDEVGGVRSEDEPVVDELVVDGYRPPEEVGLGSRIDAGFRQLVAQQRDVARLEHVGLSLFDDPMAESEAMFHQEHVVQLEREPDVRVLQGPIRVPFQAPDDLLPLHLVGIKVVHGFALVQAPRKVIHALGGTIPVRLLNVVVDSLVFRILQEADEGLDPAGADLSLPLVRIVI